MSSIDGYPSDTESEETDTSNMTGTSNLNHDTERTEMAGKKKAPKQNPNPQDAKKNKKGGLRDHRKVVSQVAALGGAPLAVKPRESSKIHTLVVCGATNADHGWMWSDFMAAAMLLGAGNEATILSCFPIHDHFVRLANQKSPPVTDIKFGSYGDNGEHLFSYTRIQYCSREYFWEQVSAGDLTQRVIDWIKNAQTQAGANDVVRIFLKAHGKPNGAVSLGTGDLHPYVFSDLLNGFHPDTLIYTVASSCRSGRFIDAIQASGAKNRIVTTSTSATEPSFGQTKSTSGRIRSSRFVAAWAGALSTAEIPGYPSRAERAAWSIQDHGQFVVDKLTRDITPTATASEKVAPRHWHSADIDPSQQLEALVIRRMSRDLNQSTPPKNPKTEWPTLNKNLLFHLAGRPVTDTPQIIRDSNKAIAESALTTAQQEVAKCEDTSLVTDLLIHDQMSFPTPDWRSIIRNLWWRSRRQYIIWNLFQALVERGLIDPGCLTVPVNLYHGTNDTQLITELLYCLKNVRLDSDLVRDIALQSCGFYTDIEWYVSYLSLISPLLLPLLLTDSP